MKRAILVPVALVFACGGPSSSGGQGVKTPDELVADQEALAAEQEKNAGDKPVGEAGETDLEQKNKFDKRQADLELKRAARSAETCPSAVTEQSPDGKATVKLTFANDGHVKDGSISAPFDENAVGKCALNAMKAVVVPPFDGPEESVEWEINLEKKEEPKDAGAPKKK